MVPVLKFVRGETLSTDHWMELFRMVKMPKGTTLEKLIFGDILNASEEIIAHRDELKVKFYILIIHKIRKIQGECLLE